MARRVQFRSRMKTSNPLSIDTQIQIPTAYGLADFTTFTGFENEKDHFAIRFPAPNSKENSLEKYTLVRIHSECITGDLFASEKCDCGDQLQEALKLMSKHGGVLIYLRQEGRGIGLREKLRAYQLQSIGMDTFQANRALGYADDCRSYEVAAEMLRALQIESIILLTNNPEKEAALLKAGIKIEVVRPTGVYAKPANQSYLSAKKNLAGHRLSYPLLTVLRQEGARA